MILLQISFSFITVTLSTLDISMYQILLIFNLLPLKILVNNM